MNARPLPTDRETLRRAGAVLQHTIWIALAGGAIEVGVLYTRKRAQPLLQLSEDFVWMAPLALLAIVVGLAAAGLAAARIWRRAEEVAVFAAAWAVWTNVLLLVPRLAHAAVFVLAAGLALQTTRVIRRDRIDAWIRRSTVWLLAGMAAAGGLMWVSLRPPAATRPAGVPPGTPPNVLLITLDTVRAANLNLYGYARQTMPGLETFAAKGVVFERAFSTAPWTLPSHAGMFTGRWAHELSTGYTSPLDGTHVTLAEYFGRLGYHTAGFVANLGYCAYETGLGRGFQHYEDYPRSGGQVAASSTLVRTIADNFRLRRLIQNDEHLNRVRASTINRRVLEWLPDDGRPFFAFLNYFDAHEPYLPPAPFDQRFGDGRAVGRHSPLHHWLWNRAVAHGNMGEAERREEIDAYDGALAALDRDLTALLTTLESRGALQNTIVVITSDHGEEFGEHGVYDHGYSLYRASLQVPLVIVAPGRIPAEIRIASPVSLRDLAATLADLVDAESAPFPGLSLRAHWTRGGGPAESSPVFAIADPSGGQPDWFPSSRGRMHTVVVGQLRYIQNGDGREELYDLTADPWEQTNLAATPEHQADLVAARTRLEALLRPAGS